MALHTSLVPGASAGGEEQRGVEVGRAGGTGASRRVLTGRRAGRSAPLPVEAMVSPVTVYHTPTRSATRAATLSPAVEVVPGVESKHRSLRTEASCSSISSTMNGQSQMR